MQRKTKNKLQIYKSTHSIQHKKLLAYFYFGNKIETSVNRQKTRFPILKERKVWWRFWSWLRDLDWIESSIIVFDKIYCNKQRTTTGQSTMNFCFIHDREFSCVTEDIVKETFTKNISYLFRKFSQQECKQTHKSLSSCWCSLFVKSLPAERLMPASVSWSPSVKLKCPHCPIYTLKLSFLIFNTKFWVANFHKC
jgi:hypothetical protein